MKAKNDIHKRTVWAATRSMLETDLAKRQRNGVKSKRNWKLFSLLMKGFCLGLRITGLRKRGMRNALDISLTEKEVFFEDLPDAFDGYRILFMSDLHLDSHEELSDRIVSIIQSKTFDLCLLGGDYRKHIMGSYNSIKGPFEEILNSINAKDGTYAVLGNHDTYLMVEPMERNNVQFLINEHIVLERNGQKICITGVDDPYYYFTDAAIQCMEEKPAEFGIALVHTPELYDIAEENDYRFYLCGHTHAGQICLPGGRPIITHLSNGKNFFYSFWKHSNLKGYTSAGVGTSGLSVRFNSRGEVCSFVLRKKALKA